MATIREGNKAGLLVVDVQVGVMSDAREAHRIINNIGIATECCDGLAPLPWAHKQHNTG